MIKKSYASFAFITAFLIFCSSIATSVAFSETKFGVGAIAGLGYPFSGGMNSKVKYGADDTAFDFNEDYNTSAFKDKTDYTYLAYGFDLEARVIGDSFGVGYSVGYHVDGQPSFTVEADGFEEKYSYSLELSSTVHLLTLYYKHVLDESSFILFGAGPGYYNSKIKEVYKRSGSYNYKVENVYSGRIWGGHIKVEYNYLIGSVDVFAGLFGHYGKGSHFENESGGHLFYSEESFAGVLVYFGIGFLI